MIKEYVELANQLELLKNTSGKNDKITLIGNICKTPMVNEVVRFLLDDRIVTGMDLKKIRKNTKVSEGSYTLPDILKYLKVNNTGSDKNVSVVKAFLNELPIEVQPIYEQIFTKTLNLGIGVKGYNEAFPNSQIYEHEIMKGHLYDPDKFNKIRKKYGQKFWCTTKVDGNRGSYAIDDISGKFKLISPNGKVHVGYEHITSELQTIFGDNYFIDGELEYIDKSGAMTNDEIRQKTSSICSSKSESKLEIGYKVFHILPIKEWESKGFTTEYEYMRGKLDCFGEDIDSKYISILPVLYSGTDEDMIMEIFKEQRLNHKEGIIINFNCVYIQGKKDGIMKVKDVLTLDLKVVDWKCGKENTRLSETLGALQVELEVDGKIYLVDAGSGIKDEFREKFMPCPEDYMNKIAEIMATEVSKNKDGGYSLSYPRFIEFRDDKSMPDRIVSKGKKFEIV